MLAMMGELMIGLSRYFAFYNGERLLQSLRNKTPDVVYRIGKRYAGELRATWGFSRKPPPKDPRQGGKANSLSLFQSKS